MNKIWQLLNWWPEWCMPRRSGKREAVIVLAVLVVATVVLLWAGMSPEAGTVGTVRELVVNGRAPAELLGFPHEGKIAWCRPYRVANYIRIEGVCDPKSFVDWTGQEPDLFISKLKTTPVEFEEISHTGERFWYLTLYEAERLTTIEVTEAGRFRILVYDENRR